MQHSGPRYFFEGSPRAAARTAPRKAACSGAGTQPPEASVARGSGLNPGEAEWVSIHKRKKSEKHLLLGLSSWARTYRSHPPVHPVHRGLSEGSGPARRLSAQRPQGNDCEKLSALGPTLPFLSSATRPSGPCQLPPLTHRDCHHLCPDTGHSQQESLRDWHWQHRRVKDDAGHAQAAVGRAAELGGFRETPRLRPEEGRQLATSKDGRRVFSAGRGRQSETWNTASGLMSLDYHRARGSR